MCVRQNTKYVSRPGTRSSGQVVTDRRLAASFQTFIAMYIFIIQRPPYTNCQLRDSQISLFVLSSSTQNVGHFVKQFGGRISQKLEQTPRILGPLSRTHLVATETRIQSQTHSGVSQTKWNHILLLCIHLRSLKHSPSFSPSKTGHPACSVRLSGTPSARRLRQTTRFPWK